MGLAARSYYADRPANRPHCDLTATVGLGRHAALPVLQLRPLHPRQGATRPPTHRRRRGRRFTRGWTGRRGGRDCGSNGVSGPTRRLSRRGRCRDDHDTERHERQEEARAFS